MHLPKILKSIGQVARWALTALAMSILVFSFIGEEFLFSGRRAPLGDVRGIAVGPEGHLYVLSINYRRVQAYDPQGRFLFAIEPPFIPHSFSFDHDSVLYVWDAEQARAYTPKGTPIPLQSGRAPGVADRAADDRAAGPDGSVYRLMPPQPPDVSGPRWRPRIERVSPGGSVDAVIRDPWWLWVLQQPLPLGAFGALALSSALAAWTVPKMLTARRGGTAFDCVVHHHLRDEREPPTAPGQQAHAFAWAVASPAPVPPAADPGLPPARHRSRGAAPFLAYAGRFTECLHAGEQLLWVGRPARQTLSATEQGYTIAAVGVLVVLGGAAVKARLQGRIDSLACPLALVVFLLMLILPTPFGGLIRRGRTRYAITNRRILILDAGGRCAELELKQISDLSVFRHGDGTATVAFIEAALEVELDQQRLPRFEHLADWPDAVGVLRATVIPAAGARPMADPVTHQQSAQLSAGSASEG